MKKIYFILAFLCAAVAFCQPPAGYYNAATGTGYTLKTQLFNIINDHNDRGYAGLYTTYLTSDKDFFYENDGTMLDLYSENPTGAECAFTYGTGQDDGTLGNNECERYNREHIVPQSVFSAATPMYSDAHFVLPSDKHVNAQRGDLPFGKVNNANWTSINGSKRGSNLNSGYSAGYSATVFEPIDEFKGDIARCLLYFATRYEDVVAGYSYVMFNGTSNQVFSQPFLNILLTWNAMDPVSQREITRNNAIYARQGNRNPFIDDNTYVNRIWGAPLATDNFDALATLRVFPNPATNHQVSISGVSALNSIEIYNVSGQLVRQIEQPNFQENTYTIENIPSGFYLLKIATSETATIKKIMVN